MISAGQRRVDCSVLSHAQAAKSAEAQQQHFLNAYYLTATSDSLVARGSCRLATWGNCSGVRAGG